MLCVECKYPLVEIRSSDKLACLSWKDHTWLASGKWIQLRSGHRAVVNSIGELGFRAYVEGYDSWLQVHYQDLIDTKPFPPRPKTAVLLPSWVREGAKVLYQRDFYRIMQIRRGWAALRGPHIVDSAASGFGLLPGHPANPILPGHPASQIFKGVVQKSPLHFWKLDHLLRDCSSGHVLTRFDRLLVDRGPL